MPAMNDLKTLRSKKGLGGAAQLRIRPGARRNSAGSETVKQRTLKSAIGCTGTGLHTGATVTMTLRPASADTGIVFKRTDVDRQPVAAHVANVVDDRMGTTLGDADRPLASTVEHLMAALLGSRIDNVIVELDGPEVPIMDGSSAPFVFLIECAGALEQGPPRRIIEVLREIHVVDGERGASLVPADAFQVEFEIDFDSPAVGQQSMGVRLVNGTFKSDICRARTFGFVHEAQQMRAMGLALGASLENAVVIDGDTVMNEEGLRYADEFVRHKILDSVGDLYLAGAPIKGAFQGRRSGHAINHMVVRALLADHDAWRFATETEDEADTAPLLARA